MTEAEKKRIDLALVADIITANAKVLDVGCGDGSLLTMLKEQKSVDGRGIELSQKGVNDCVARGLSVIQGDADRDLVHYPDKSFDFVVLSQTIQATHNPRRVLEELLRIGTYCIVSAPNFGHWRMRIQLLLQGRMPVTKKLPYTWYDTPNIHFCTLRDFTDLCNELEASIEQVTPVADTGKDISAIPEFSWNLLAQQAVYLLKEKA